MVAQDWRMTSLVDEAGEGATGRMADTRIGKGTDLKTKSGTKSLKKVK